MGLPHCGVTRLSHFAYGLDEEGFDGMWKIAPNTLAIDDHFVYDWLLAAGLCFKQFPEIFGAPSPASAKHVVLDQSWVAPTGEVSRARHDAAWHTTLSFPIHAVPYRCATISWICTIDQAVHIGTVDDTAHLAAKRKYATMLATCHLRPDH